MTRKQGCFSNESDEETRPNHTVLHKTFLVYTIIYVHKHRNCYIVYINTCDAYIIMYNYGQAENFKF